LLQIAGVASQYYLDGISKVEIAQDLGLSRFKVARLLEDARDRGIVKIEIAVPDAINPRLSADLCAAYNLRQAIVVDTPDEPLATLRADLGRVAASLVTERVQDDDVVGIAWGRTLSAMAAELKQLKPCTIVQLTGALSDAEVSDNAIELVRRMAQVANGPAFPIYAPMVLDDPTTARSLRQQARVAEAMSWYDRVSIAIVPIGSWSPPHSQLYDSLSDQERTELLDAGVRADTSTVMLTETGDLLTTPLSERMIGISGEQLRHIPEVIAVAGGRDKVDAVHVALRAGIITTLITNITVAQALLDDAPNAS
jgi:DNA-binding transcriptional regulator LsrR (DeoR family)